MSRRADLDARAGCKLGGANAPDAPLVVERVSLVASLTAVAAAAMTARGVRSVLGWRRDGSVPALRPASTSIRRLESQLNLHAAPLRKQPFRLGRIQVTSNPMLGSLAVTAVCSSLAAPAWAQACSTALGTADGSHSATGLSAGCECDGSSAESAFHLHGISRTNLLWRAPFGGRSAPIVMGSQLCVGTVWTRAVAAGTRDVDVDRAR
jgi:hypothetical protein